MHGDECPGLPSGWHGCDHQRAPQRRGQPPGVCVEPDLRRYVDGRRCRQQHRVRSRRQAGDHDRDRRGLAHPSSDSSGLYQGDLMNDYEPPAPVVWSLDEIGDMTQILFSAETPLYGQNTNVWIAQYPCRLRKIEGLGKGAEINVRKSGTDIHLDENLALNDATKEAPELNWADYSYGDAVEVLIPKGGAPFVDVRLEFVRLK